MPYKDARGSGTCNSLFLFRSPLGKREVGAGMAFPCVWCCRPPGGLGVGSQVGGKEAIGGERQFSEISLCVVPQLGEWCDAEQGCHTFPSFLHSAWGERKKEVSAGLQPGGLVVHLLSRCGAAPKPCQHAWPHHCCGKLGNCRDCFIVLENGDHRKRLLFSKVTLLGAITENGR